MPLQNVELGECLVFDGPNLCHGNAIRLTNITQVDEYGAVVLYVR